jgi:predicted nucleotidyltransferase
MVKTRDEALKIAEDFIEKANDVFFIKEAYVFGSYVYGEPKETSDIDVALISSDFEKIPFNLASKLVNRLASTVSTLIEPIIIDGKEFEYAMPGTLAFELSTKAIKISPFLKIKS